ncbi:MAG: DNA-binding protein [Betaproteobacteria bacterium]|nr:DNA-binding protein [Betaproteobacteria bacterium]
MTAFSPLEQVTRPTVPTDAAAYYLNRQPQTLRAWASLENGPIRPIRINGRLAWKVSDIKSLLNGEAI